MNVAANQETALSGCPAEARRLVEEYAMWSMAAAMLPLSGIDLAATAAVQLRMLQRLSRLYGVPFAEGAARSAIAALLGSLGAGALKQSVVGQVLKSVPVMGPVPGMMTLPGFAMAFTYAIGRVFSKHFESGGSFRDFRLETVQDLFRREFIAVRARVSSAGGPAL